MKKTLSLIVCGFLAAMSVCAQAQPTPTELLICDGSSSGTYKLFVDQMQPAVQDYIRFKEVESHGATENLDNLINNKCAAALMHNDVLAFRATSEDLGKFKTLLTLFQEEVHFVALRNSGIVVGAKASTFGFGGKAGTIVEFNDVSDLKGYTIGAAGGGVITANTINQQAGIGATVQEYASGAEALDALRKGQVQAVVFVGAAPLPNVEKLNGQEVKLLNMGPSIQDRVRSVYKPTKITYTKISPTAVNTVAAKCLLVSKEYRSKTMIETLDKFRQAFFDSLPDIAEKPGNHRKWNEVTPTDHGRWAWLNLPSDSKQKVKDDEN